MEGLDDHNASSLDMFVTHSPCQACAREIQATKMFRRIFFRTEYRDSGPLDWLAQTMEVYRVTPAGYVTRYLSSELIDPASLYP